MNSAGRWDINPSLIIGGHMNCGPANPSVDAVTEFVNPITRTVVHLTVPVPYDRFSQMWPTLVAWLTDGWKVLHADPTSIVLPGGAVKDEQASEPRAEEGQRS